MGNKGGIKGWGDLIYPEQIAEALERFDKKNARATGEGWPLSKIDHFLEIGRYTPEQASEMEKRIRKIYKSLR